MTRRFFLLSLVMMATACGSAQVAPENRPRTRSDRLTQEDIRQTELLTMYEVIQRLQPSWLVVPQGRVRTVEVGVFVDGLRMGNVEFLRNLPASQIREARYLNSRQVSAELTSSQAFNLSAAIMLASQRM
ncbi:MAG TPA: hypothetical protein VF006_17435 [Longimicrobium sp.]